MATTYVLTYCEMQTRQDGNAAVNTWHPQKAVYSTPHECCNHAETIMRKRNINGAWGGHWHQFYQGRSNRLEFGSMREPDGYILMEAL